MDAASILLMLQLFTEWTALAAEINKILQRVQAGDVITTEELEAAKAKSKEAVQRWDSITGYPGTPTSVTEPKVEGQG